MIEELRQKILGWINIGPLGTLAGRQQDMRLTADALGVDAVVTILDLLTEGETDDDEELQDSALEFAEVYAAQFPKLTASAGLSRLSTDGPVSVVAVLAATGERSIVPKLLEIRTSRRRSVSR